MDDLKSRYDSLMNYPVFNVEDACNHELSLVTDCMDLCCFSASAQTPPVPATVTYSDSLSETDSSFVTVNDIVIIGKQNYQKNMSSSRTHIPQIRQSASLFCRKTAAQKRKISSTHLFSIPRITWLRKVSSLRRSSFWPNRWYIFLYPFSNLPKRNFNVWWENKDLNRIVVYGGILNWNNFRGRKWSPRHFSFGGYLNVSVLLQHSTPQ